MAKTRKQGTKSAGIGFSLLIAAFVLVYILPRLITFVDTGTNNYVIAKSGRIDDSIELTGIVTREEQLFRAVSSGVVQYYYPGGRSLAKNTVIATISDADYYGDLLTDRKDVINSKISDLSESDTEYGEEFVQLKKNIRFNVQQYQKNKDYSQYGSIYDLKDTLSAAIHQRQDLYSLLSGSTARTLLEEQALYDKVEKEASDDLWISEAGIISYAYDGYEGWDASMVRSDFLEKYKSTYDYLNINLQEVRKGDPVYRLVTSQIWHITAFLAPKDAERLEIVEGDDITFYDGDEKLTGTVESLEETTSQEQYKLVIRMQSRLTDYLDRRLVSISLSNNTYEGMKVPNACLTEEEFYSVPTACIFQSDDQVGVMTRTASGDTFVPIDFDWHTENEYFFKEADITEGTVLLQEGSNDTYLLRAASPTFGVYLVNGVTENFKHVTVLYQNEDYAIIEGLSQYDHVKILDA